jgi:hypothetical protein
MREAQQNKLYQRKGREKAMILDNKGDAKQNRCNFMRYEEKVFTV